MKDLERQRDQLAQLLIKDTLNSTETMHVLRTVMTLLQDASWRLDTLEQSSHEHYGETP